jgi:L-alanine-DL-glutamate epimerase and related enzymes of enolase superfamily
VRITGISTHVVGTPWRNLTYVQVHTDEGITGVGETRMLGHTDALLGYLHEAQANHILGSDPFAVEDLVRRMKYGDYGRAGEIVMSGIAVIEMACWDIKGKALGVPVWQLLGGKVTDRVKAYANGWYTTERTPEAYHKAAQEVVARGYKALKIDPFGTGHFELDHAATLYSVSLIEAVRDAIGPETELMLEMHGRFSPSTAVRLAHELAPFKPAWLEEPVPPENLKALEKVAAKVDIPSPRVNASTTASSSASSSRARPWTSSSPTSATSAASGRPASSPPPPRRTTSWSRRTTSAARC